MRLFVADDWAEAHHDAEVMDAFGRRLATALDPASAAKLPLNQIGAALKRARRRGDLAAREECFGQHPAAERSVLARFVHNDRLIDALMTQTSVAQRVSPGARAYYDKQRARGVGYNTALRQLANRLVGILHGCLKTGTLYDAATAWSHHVQSATA
ncbi:hypothetical protein [Nonomuraea jabiensis]|uniref:hypothetical protein n=1 Tax=Nonomuraea jabiensis TaxID=882448 RepID=UPI00369185BE